MRMTLGLKMARVMMMVVIAASVAAIVASITVVKQANQLDKIERRIGAGSIDQVGQEADSNARNRHFALTSEDKATRIDGVLTVDGRGFLTGGDVEDAGSDRVYQLWVDTSAGPISLGVLGDDAKETFAFNLPAGALRLYVTNEPAVASTVPASSVVVQGEVPSFRS